MPGTVLAPEALRVVNYAHRGASGLAPENTMAAFEAAAAHGAHVVELDVRRTADGHLVVMHDPSPARTTNVAELFPDRAEAPVSDFTLAELRRLDAGGWRDPSYAGERIPTFDEAMDLFAQRDLRVLLEVKAPGEYPGIAEQIVAELRSAYAGWLSGRMIVQSFDWEFMRALRSLLPRIPVGLLGAPDVAQLSAYAGFVDHVNPPRSAATAEYVESVHQWGMAVNVWTVDDPAEMSRLIASGVDGIITNRPDLLHATFAVAPDTAG